MADLNSKFSQFANLTDFDVASIDNLGCIPFDQTFGISTVSLCIRIFKNKDEKTLISCMDVFSIFNEQKFNELFLEV
jgi:hypothetical protein